ncbi:MAG: cupin domain-containing protein [Burkholderiales bacterium]|nr:cupin domain-containing protein [Burkholderiales bacterium]
MAIAHTAAGELVDVIGPGGAIGPDSSETLIRTDHLQVFRYALVAGKIVDTHEAAGTMVVQCLQGTVDFTALGATRRLTPGKMLYLADHEPHGLTAITDALLLITIVLNRV